jgi:hypothetical protein
VATEDSAGYLFIYFIQRFAIFSFLHFPCTFILFPCMSAPYSCHWPSFILHLHINLRQHCPQGPPLFLATERRCIVVPVRYELNLLVCYVEESRPPLWSSGQSSWLHNGDVLCFLWGTNWIYICYGDESRPLLWYSGQSSWLHNGDVLCFLWGTNWIYMLCRRK